MNIPINASTRSASLLSARVKHPTSESSQLATATPPPIANKLMQVFTATPIYPVISHEFCLGRTEETVIAAALAAGAKVIQLRDKTHSTSTSASFTTKVRSIKKLTEQYKALLIINDNIDIALAEANGVHLGQNDLPLHLAFAKRHQAKRDHDFIIGLSTHNAAEIKVASTFARSELLFYMNIGPIYPTQTKAHPTTPALGIANFKNLNRLFKQLLNDASHSNCRETGYYKTAMLSAVEENRIPAERVNVRLSKSLVPVTVMGGIKERHLKELVLAGAKHFAMVTEITTAPNVEQKVRALITAVNTIKQSHDIL
ncbi:thiamine-phosphate synthase [Spirochaetota bacterium]|nr:thiamine-phosphate synthase [Spirochaetota bacterium]